MIGYYGGAVSDTIQSATTGSTQDLGDLIYKTFIKPWQQSFTADPVYSNQVTQDFYTKLDEANRKALSRNARENIDPGASTPEERTRSALQKAADQMADFKKQEQEVLLGDLSQAEKDAQVRELRQKALDVAKQAMEQYDAGPTNTRVYPAGVDDQKRDAYDKVIASGVSEDKVNAAIARVQALKPTGLNKTVTQKQRRTEVFNMHLGGKLTLREFQTINNYLYPQ